MMDGWSMNGWGWMSLGSLVAIVVILLLVRVMMDGAGSRGLRTQEDPALEALRRRFSAGEIDEDEFNRRRAALARQV